MLNQKKPSKTIMLTKLSDTRQVVIQKRFVISVTESMDEELVSYPQYETRTVRIFWFFKRRVSIEVAPAKFRKVPRVVVSTIGGFRYDVHETFTYIKHLLEE